MKKLFVFLFLFCSLISSYAGTVIKLGTIAPVIRPLWPKNVDTLMMFKLAGHSVSIFFR